MKEKVKVIILSFIYCLSILSLNGCYNKGLMRMDGWGFYTKLEIPALIDKDKISIIKLYYGHDYDYSLDDDSYFSNVLFEFKLSIISFDGDKNDEKIVIFIKNQTRDFIKDQSSKVETSGPWIWSKVTFKKKYDVEFAFSDYNYERGLLSYEFSFDFEDDTEFIRKQTQIIKNFKTNQSTVYFYD